MATVQGVVAGHTGRVPAPGLPVTPPVVGRRPLAGRPPDVTAPRRIDRLATPALVAVGVPPPAVPAETAPTVGPSGAEGRPRRRAVLVLGLAGLPTGPIAVTPRRPTVTVLERLAAGASGPVCRDRPYGRLPVPPAETPTRPTTLRRPDSPVGGTAAGGLCPAPTSRRPMETGVETRLGTPLLFLITSFPINLP